MSQPHLAGPPFLYPISLDILVYNLRAPRTGSWHNVFAHPSRRWAHSLHYPPLYVLTEFSRTLKRG